MAGQSITFDFLSRGAASLSRDFRSVGDDSALASRGVKVLQDVIEKLGSKEDRTAAESKLLASALRQTGDAADRVTAKAVLADAAVGRLGEQMKNAESKSSGLSKAMKGLSFNPGMAGPLVALTPAIATLGGVVAAAGVGLAGAFVAGGAALAAFGAVAKPVLSSALTASQAVNTAQNTYQATIAAGVPTAQAQANLAKANASAQLTYNAAIAGGANPAKALAAEHLALAKNQLAYNSATNAGTFNAKAYAAEQKAIAKAYADLSPQQIALSKQLGAMAQAWQDLKAAQTPVVAGALQPWLKAVTDLTKNLGPIIAGVSPIIAYLGQQFDALINSSAFKAFRDFIAGTGSAVVSATGSTIIDLIKAFMIVLPQFDPLIKEAALRIAMLGPAVLKWAGSQKTADQIQAFMSWFSRNGPVVGDLLKNIGLTLKALAPGLSAGGVAELKIISDFFGLTAKLPKDIAKPLAEVAGAMLILSKMGVLKVGIQFVGAAVKWLTGGAISIGGGEAAAAAMRAAFATGGAAAAAEMRAALTGGGAAAGAGGAAGGAAKGGAGLLGLLSSSLLAIVGGFFGGQGAGALFNKLDPKATSPGSVWARTGTEVAGGAAAGAAIGSIVPVLGTAIGAGLGALGGLIAGILANPKQSLKGVTDAFDAARHHIANTWDGLRHDIARITDLTFSNTIGSVIRFGHNVETQFSSLRHSTAVVFDGIRGDIAHYWDMTWNNTITRAANGVKDVVAWWGNLRSGTVAAYNTVRTSIADAWNAVWANTRAVVSAGVAAVAGFWRTLVSGVTSAYNTVRTSIAAAWSAIWANTTSAVSAGIAAVVRFFTGLPGKITAALGAAGSLLLGWGKGIITGMLSGMTSVIGDVWNFIKGIPGKILSFLGIKSPPQWAIDAGKHIMNGLGIGMAQAQNAGKAAAQAFGASTAAAGKAGAGVQQWAGLVRQALAMEHLNPGYLNDVLYQMQTESGGNSRAINLTDINAQLGDPSRGLMQVIMATFLRWHWPGTSFDIYDPLANIAASLNYAAHGKGFGSGPGQIGSGHGYAGGTSSALPGWAWVGERGPELLHFRGGEQVRPASGIPLYAIPGGTSGPGDLAGRLDRLSAQMAELIRTTAAVPAATGRHVGGYISGAAGDAAYRNRYPQGGW